MSPPMSHRSYVSVSGLETREWKMMEWYSTMFYLTLNWFQQFYNSFNSLLHCSFYFVNRFLWFFNIHFWNFTFAGEILNCATSSKLQQLDWSGSEILYFMSNILWIIDVCYLAFIMVHLITDHPTVPCWNKKHFW